MLKFYLPFVLVLLLFFLYIALKRFVTAYKSNNWHETEGEILSAKLIHLGKTMTLGANKEKYTCAISYSYSVLGEKYQGKKISFFPIETSTSKKQIEKQVAKFTVGKPQTVYFNPKKPSEAILQKGLSAYSFFALFVILFMIGMVAWIFLDEVAK